MALASREVVDGKARYEGRSLREWIPTVVDLLVDGLDPLCIVSFGSVARGDDGPDSDIDLMVVIDDERDRGEAARAALLIVARLPPEVDVIVVPQSSVDKHRDVAGTLIRPALREGRVVYRRAR